MIKPELFRYQFYNIIVSIQFWFCEVYQIRTSPKVQRAGWPRQPTRTEDEGRPAVLRRRHGDDWQWSWRRLRTECQRVSCRTSSACRPNSSHVSRANASNILCEHTLPALLRRLYGRSPYRSWSERAGSVALCCSSFSSFLSRMPLSASLRPWMSFTLYRPSGRAGGIHAATLRWGSEHGYLLVPSGHPPGKWARVIFFYARTSWQWNSGDNSPNVRS